MAPQKEIVEKVHAELTGKVTFSDLVNLIGNAILNDGETAGDRLLARLGPATVLYNKTYPEDISDGPYDI